MKLRNIFMIALMTTTAASAAVAAQQAPVSGPLSERVDHLEQMMGSGSASNLGEQLTQLQQEVEALRGELETANHRIEKLSTRQQDLYSDLDSRINLMTAKKTTSTTSSSSKKSAPYP